MGNFKHGNPGGRGRRKHWVWVGAPYGSASME
jgi:hypothetical protein